MEFGPLDVRSHQLVGESVVAPKGVAQEIHEIQPVPFRADAGILEMLSGIGALLEDLATRRHDHHAEAVENTDITGFVDGIDDGVGTSYVNGDLCMRWDAGPLQLKQETAHGHGALDRRRI